MFKSFIAILVSALVVCAPVAGFAQEEQDTEYGYGTIVEIRKEANEIVVNEYDWETGEEGAVVYSIGEEIDVDNAKSWDSIPNGTYVDIEYVMDEKGKKVAGYVSAYEPEQESYDLEDAE